jgi:hypothetical protein
MRHKLGHLLYAAAALLHFSQFSSARTDPRAIYDVHLQRTDAQAVGQQRAGENEPQPPPVYKPQWRPNYDSSLNEEKQKLDLEAKARVQDRGQRAYPKGNKFVDNDELPPEEGEIFAQPAIQDVAEGDDDGNMDSSNLSLGQEGDEDADRTGHHDDDNNGGAPLDLAEADVDLPGRKEHVAAGSSEHDLEAGADSNTASMGDKVSGSNDAPVPGAKQHIDPKVAAVFEKATSEIAAMRKVFNMRMCGTFGWLRITNSQLFVAPWWDCFGR